MRKIREVLRLRYDHKMTYRKAGAACGQSCASVLDYGYRPTAANLERPFPEALSDEAVEPLFFPPTAPRATDRPLPDWNFIRSELRKRGVTMALVWQEYLKKNPSEYRGR